MVVHMDELGPLLPPLDDSDEPRPKGSLWQETPSFKFDHGKVMGVVEELCEIARCDELMERLESVMVFLANLNQYSAMISKMPERTIKLVRLDQWEGLAYVPSYLRSTPLLTRANSRHYAILPWNVTDNDWAVIDCPFPRSKASSTPSPSFGREGRSTIQVRRTFDHLLNDELSDDFSPPENANTTSMIDDMVLGGMDLDQSESLEHGITAGSIPSPGTSGGINGDSELDITVHGVNSSDEPEVHDATPLSSSSTAVATPNSAMDVDEAVENARPSKGGSSANTILSDTPSVAHTATMLGRDSLGDGDALVVQAAATGGDSTGRGGRSGGSFATPARPSSPLTEDDTQADGAPRGDAETTGGASAGGTSGESNEGPKKPAKSRPAAKRKGGGRKRR